MSDPPARGPNFRLVREERWEGRLVEAAARSLAAQQRARPEGLHVSDLISPLRAYWRLTVPKEPTAREVGLFIVGHQLHEMVTKLAGWKVPDPAWHEEVGVWYSLDAALEDGTPVEIKTSRSLWQPRDASDGLGLYLRQLLMYQALVERSRGLLVVWYLMLRDTDGKTTPRPLVWSVHVEPSTLPTIREAMREMAAQLRRAVEERDPSDLPLCEDWMCESCPWWHDCQPPGRYDALV